MAEQEREELESLARWFHNEGDGGIWESFCWAASMEVARALLASDWLAARDAALIAEARAEARREALYEASDELAVTAYEDGRDDERVHIVRWLRKKADQITPHHGRCIVTFRPRLNADRAEALDRLGERVTNLPDADRTPYLFLCLGILGSNAPEVLHFVLDRADERVDTATKEPSCD